jgi:hypothetical protein
MKSFIMAEISKCNGNTTGNTFVDSSDGTTQTLGAGAGACPLSTSATGQADAKITLDDLHGIKRRTHMQHLQEQLRVQLP